MADASQNKPKKELLYALVGLVAFLSIVLLIGISAFLRPAGNHVAPEPVVAETTDEEVATDIEATAETAETSDTATTETESTEADNTMTQAENAESDNLELAETVDLVEVEEAPTPENAEQFEDQSVGEDTVDVSQ